MIDQTITLQGAGAEAGKVFVMNVDTMIWECENWDQALSIREMLALIWLLQLGPIL